jgi:hypothetical protein
VSSIVVSGAIANKPLSGGEAWVRMSWVRGLRRLGHEVMLVEQIDGSDCVDEKGRPAPFEDSANRRAFEAAIDELGDGCAATLICDGGRQTLGLEPAEVVDRAADADLLVNVSGHLRDERIKSGPKRRAYVDVDPGFTQIWADSGGDVGLAGHDAYFTVGENVGMPGCAIPTAGVEWVALPPPVTLEDWPVAPPPVPGRFTTVATWRSPLGTLTHEGKEFRGKHHQWRDVLPLPDLSPHDFEIAVRIEPSDSRDREALEAHGWSLEDPRQVAGDPLAFRAYVQRSAAEFSVAHPVYVETRSGWISDRTVRYLATGRPALVQDTGVGRDYELGKGLVTFRTTEEAVAGAARIAADYDTHAQAARSIAESHFDSDLVLGRFLERAGA